MSTEPEDIEKVVKEIFETEITPVINEIMAGLKSDDLKVKGQAFTTLNRSLNPNKSTIYDMNGNYIGSGQIMEKLMEKFRESPNFPDIPNLGREIMKALNLSYCNIIREYAFESLIGGLKYDLLRNDILWCFKYLNDPRAIEPAIILLNDTSRLDPLLLDLFIQFKDVSLEPLLKLQNSDNKFVRRTIAAYLGDTRNSSYLDVLIKFLDDKDWNVRFNSIVALGKIGNEKSLEAIMKCTQDESANVRKKATEIIGVLASGNRLPTREEVMQPNQ